MDVKFLPVQKRFLQSTATQTLIGGACGSSKSFFSRVLSIIYATQISNLQVVLVRKHHDELKNTHFSTAPGAYADLLKDEIKSGFCTITTTPMCVKFKNGSVITALPCQYESDLGKFLGVEIGLLIIDESTTLTEKQLKFIRSRVRIVKNDKTLKELEALRKSFNIDFALPKILYASNPGSASHTYHKQTFIDPAPPNTVFIDKDSGLTTEYCPAFLTDNKYLDTDEYTKNLKSMGNPELVKAYLEGSWDVVIGGSVLDGYWDASKHVIKSFKIPKEWKITRAADWGFNDPTVCLYFAESNGEDALDRDGNTIYTRNGDLFLIYEYTTLDKNGKSMRKTPDEVARDIKKIDDILKPDQNNSPIDNQVFAVTDGTCIYDTFKKHKVKFIPCSKGPGSRAAGVMKVCEYLENVTTHSGPTLKIFDTCRDIIRDLPLLPRSKTDVNDVDKNCEFDHGFAALRYKLMTKEHKVVINPNILL